MKKSHKKKFRECFLYLGHNASAVLFNSADDFIVIEEEKIIRWRGGEYVPLALVLRLRHYNVESYYIMNFLGPVIYEKFFLALFRGRNENLQDFLSTRSFFELKLNHHLCHLYHALINFLNSSTPFQSGTYHFIVNDGSGNDFESVSLYSAEIHVGDSMDSLFKIAGRLKMLFKERADHFSCGHLYARILCNNQTGFTVLRDEYKSLGYDTNIFKVLNANKVEQLLRIVDLVIDSYIHGFPNSIKHALQADMAQFLPGQAPAEVEEPETDFEKTVHSLSFDFSQQAAPVSLMSVRHNRAQLISNGFHEHFAHRFSMRFFQEMVKTMVPPPSCINKWTKDLGTFEKRVIHSFLANALLISYYKKLIKKYNITHLVASGGVHFNVRLNNFILRTIPGSFSVSPLCGDVGHIITCVALKNKNFRYRIKKLDLLDRMQAEKIAVTHERVIITYTENDFIERISSLVANGHIVNIWKGLGELGPRALMNTTTISLPGDRERSVINQLNGRDDQMPMAPVILEKNLGSFFVKQEYDRLVSSLAYMIVALTYLPGVDVKQYGGVMHFDPVLKTYSGRPQVIYPDDKLNTALLEAIEQKTHAKAFINTSFNIHGKATVLTIQDALNDFEYQLKNSTPSTAPYLVIYNGN